MKSEVGMRKWEKRSKKRTAENRIASFEGRYSACHESLYQTVHFKKIE
jgi:hypothetical protein